MELSQKAQACLAALNKFDRCRTADEVADVLRTAGVTGVRLSACECPVANFLDRETGNAVHLVNSQTIDVGSHWQTFTPTAVSEFIRAFDHGKFLDLVT